MKKFIRDNSLSLVFFLLFIVALYLQAITGWHVHNDELVQDKAAAISFAAYLQSGHFISAVFENWESEFLQMALFVIATMCLYQRGSSESKDPDGGTEEVDREPDPNRKDAPWPVRRGGIWLKLYKNSLTYLLLILFILSWILHFYGSFKDENDEQLHKGLPLKSITDYFMDSRFWFESMQNWQSEFLSVFAIVILSVFLRQKGSPQSKPVDAPTDETGE